MTAPTPTAVSSYPDYVRDDRIALSENSREVLRRRYLRKGLDGKPIETPAQMFYRVARHLAAAEAHFGGDVEATTRVYYDLLTGLRFFPNSPTFTGAGTPLGQLAACFTADMRVTTEQGVKRIADLQIGDRVLTHLGRYRPVTELHQRAYSGTLLRIKIKLIGTILEVTPEHPIMTPAGWVQADELRVGDKVAVGIPQGIRLAPHTVYKTTDRKSPRIMRTLRMTLGNPGLVQQVWQMCLRLGYDAAIRPVDTTYVTQNARATAQISLPPLQSRDLVQQAFGVDLPEPDIRYIRNSVTRQGNTVYFEIDSIEAEAYTGIVYNCEVDEDHSYVTEGIVVHNCFVLPIEDDMGKHPDGIFQTLRNAALIQQTGGGNGFSFGRLRPRGDKVLTSAGVATGPVGFLEAFDKAFGVIAQGGTRRGANMAVLPIHHPDIEEFITCKAEEGKITNFNISVGITDAFMQAVIADKDFNLINPRDGKVWRTVRARDLFDKIATHAHHNGEPGVLFLDTANRTNPVPHLYELEATNPCGEQWLGPYENCCLGSVNLARHVTEDNTIDWDLLAETVATATRFLDDVVEVNAYVPAVPQLKEAAYRVRRIGLGIMGLADVMYMLGVRYGSEEGEELAAQIMEFVRYHAMRTSIELARERGPFPAIRGSIYDPTDLKWTPPMPLTPYKRDFGRPPLNWDAIVAGIKAHGIRNGAQTTIAPTGCLVPGTLVATDQGLLPIELLGDPRGERWQEIDLAVASEGGVRPATQFYVNGRAHTLRLLTRHGYTLQGTDGHRIRVWEKGAWVWRRMDELQPGMIVPLQATGLIGQPRRVRLDTTLVTDFHASPITLPDEVTPDLAYLVGFFMGDGSLKERSLRFSLSDPTLRDRLTTLLKRVFDCAPVASKDGRSSGLESLEVHSLNLVAFWRRNGFAKAPSEPGHKGKGYRPHIPLAILHTNNRQVYAAFLAGLFDADASLHRGYLLTWTTTDQAFHDQVKVLLLTLGILTTSDRQITGLGQSTLYRLRVAHAEAALQLAKELPYLCRVIPTNGHVRRHTLGDTVPLTTAQAHQLLSLAGNERERWNGWAWQQRQRISRESLRAFVTAHRAEMLAPDLRELVEAVESPLFYDEIQAVEDGGWQETYDLSVPATHAYVANGFISHNTIGTVTGCEGYGCEPVFALAYTRYVKEAEGDVPLTYVSPLFLRALDEAGIVGETRQRIIDEILHTGTCQHIGELPDHILHTFVVSQDITPTEHVRIQAALQRFVDNSISKTINFPPTATVEAIKTAYRLAWELGCKGITVYVTGSREEVVLETKATATTKGKTTSAPTPPAPTPTSEPPAPLVPPRKRRPTRLQGFTYRQPTPLGTAYVTVNSDDAGEPFEVFLNVGKAGSDVAAVAEALGRLMSYILRMPSPLPPRERLQQIVYQLGGIGGGRPLGFGPQRVRSLPDAVAQVLSQFLNESEAQTLAKTPPPPAAQMELPLSIGDLCPDCGQATMLFIEGCKKCQNCGYSEC